MMGTVLLPACTRRMMLLIILFILSAALLFGVDAAPSRARRDEKLRLVAAALEDHGKAALSWAVRFQGRLSKVAGVAKSRALVLIQELDNKLSTRENTELDTECRGGLSSLWRPKRILCVAVVSWLLAEVVEYYGLLDDPGEKALHVWKQAKTTFGKWQVRVEDWWKHTQEDGGLFNAEGLSKCLGSIPRRYRFGLGVFIGTLLTPLVLLLAKLVVPWGVGVYVASEANHYFWQTNFAQENKSLKEFVSNNQIWKSVDKSLQRWRLTVRAGLCRIHGIAGRSEQQNGPEE